MDSPNSQRKPADFDWVTVRHGCTPASIFVLLRTLAKRDVQRFNELSGGSLVTVGDTHDPSIFSVVRNHFGAKYGVVFHELSDGILVRPLTGTETTLALALNDEADCKLVWDGVPLDPWQVLRRALEPVLFKSLR